MSKRYKTEDLFESIEDTKNSWEKNESLGEKKDIKLQAELALALKGNGISDSKNSNISLEEVEKLEVKIGELDEVIGNFQTTLNLSLIRTVDHLNTP